MKCWCSVRVPAKGLNQRKKDDHINHSDLCLQLACHGNLLVKRPQTGAIIHETVMRLERAKKKKNGDHTRHVMWSVAAPFLWSPTSYYNTPTYNMYSIHTHSASIRSAPPLLSYQIPRQNEESVVVHAWEWECAFRSESCGLPCWFLCIPHHHSNTSLPISSRSVL